MLRIYYAVAAVIAGSLLWSIAAAEVSSNAAIEWSKTLLTIVGTPQAQPATLHSTRSFAILHAAIYDAVNSIAARHAPYLIQVERIPESTSQEPAADSAAHDVLVSICLGFQTTLDAQLQQDLAAIPDGPQKATAVSVGQAVARAILTLREADGSAASQPKLDLPVKPGRYQLTPPNLPSPAFTQWPGATPFGLRSAKQFRPGPPPALDSAEYTAVFIEVKSLGMDGSTTATPDQQLIGKFWGGQIQDYWNEIAQTAAEAHHLNSFFGKQPFQLAVTSEVLPGVVRNFSGFDAAEREASLSRIYADQHFRSDENAGEVLGNAVADFEVDHLLRRTHEEGDRAELDY